MLLHIKPYVLLTISMCLISYSRRDVENRTEMVKNLYYVVTIENWFSPVQEVV